MADTINVLPSAEPTAVPVATDDIDGQHYQWVKSAWGGDGAVSPVSDVDGQRLPVGGASLGNPSDAAATTDAGTFSLLALVKRLLQKFTTQLPATLTTNAGALKVGTSEAVIPVTVVIATSTTISGAVDLSGLRNWGVLVPANFDGTQIAFQTSDTLGGTYGDVYDMTNQRVVMTLTAATLRYYDVPGELMALRFLRIVTLTVQATTDTVFQIIGKT